MLLTYFHEWCNDCENCCVSVIRFPYLQRNENVNRPRVQPFVYIFAVIACCLCVNLSICLDTTVVVFANVSKCLQCDPKIIFFVYDFSLPHHTQKPAPTLFVTLSLCVSLSLTATVTWSIAMPPNLSHKTWTLSFRATNIVAVVNVSSLFNAVGLVQVMQRIGAVNMGMSVLLDKICVLFIENDASFYLQDGIFTNCSHWPTASI